MTEVQTVSAPDTIREAIAEVLAEHVGRPVGIRNLSTYGGGCINNAVRVSSTHGEFFAKWSDDASEHTLDLEAAGLRALRDAAAGRLVVPGVIGIAARPATPSILILEHLDPSVGSDIEAQDAQLGRGLAQIHTSKARVYGRVGEAVKARATPPAKEWPAHYRDAYLVPLLRRIAVERPLPADEARLHEQLCQRLPELLTDDRPVLVHGDLWHGNYMRTSGGPALIDPNAAHADREYEFGIATLFGGFSAVFWRAYQEEAPLAHGWQERNALYQWYHLLNHHRLFGGSYSSAAHATATRFL